jgi:hypothetical protein
MNPPNPAQAELSIRTAPGVPVGAPSLQRRLLRTLGRLLPTGRRPGLPLGLTVADRHGLALLDLSDACPLTRLTLPAGTYQVRTCRGPAVRAYTLTLAAGAHVKLDLSTDVNELP